MRVNIFYIYYNISSFLYITSNNEDISLIFLCTQMIIIIFLTVDVKGSTFNGTLNATVCVILCIIYTMSIRQTEKIILFDS